MIEVADCEQYCHQKRAFMIPTKQLKQLLSRKTVEFIAFDKPWYSVSTEYNGQSMVFFLREDRIP